MNNKLNTSLTGEIMFNKRPDGRLCGQWGKHVCGIHFLWE